MIKLSYVYIACNSLVKTKRRNDYDFMCMDTMCAICELTYTNSVIAPRDGEGGGGLSYQTTALT